MARFHEDLGHCPNERIKQQCGKWVKNIIGIISENGVESVEAECKVHGKVDISSQSWAYADLISLKSIKRNSIDLEDFFDEIK